MEKKNAGAHQYVVMIHYIIMFTTASSVDATHQASRPSLAKTRCHLGLEVGDCCFMQRVKLH